MNMFRNVPDLASIPRRAWPKAQREREPRTPKPNTYRPPEGFSEDVKERVAMRSGGLCEIDGCGRASEFHHRRPRGNGGTSIGWVNEAANCLHVTAECHRKAEGRKPWSRKTSKDNGWLISMNSKVVAEDVKVRYRGHKPGTSRFVLLGNDGEITELGDAA